MTAQVETFFYLALVWTQSIPVRKTVRRVVADHRMPRFTITTFWLHDEPTDLASLNRKLHARQIGFIEAFLIFDCSQSHSL